MKILFLLLLIVPLTELYVLIQVGGYIGALPTILLTVLTAVGGVALMRSQGLAVMQKAQAAMTRGEAPQEAMMEGVFIFMGGILLFIPGLITDTIGFLFLIPGVRRFLIRKSLQGQAMRGRFQYRNQQGEFFEGEWSDASQNSQSRKRLQVDIIEGELIDSDESPNRK